MNEKLVVFFDFDVYMAKIVRQVVRDLRRSQRNRTKKIYKLKKGFSWYNSIQFRNLICMEYLLKYILSSDFREKMKRVITRRSIALLLSLILGFQ